MAVQALDLFAQEIVGRFLADENQELADGFVELPTLLGFVRARGFVDGRWSSARLEFLPGGIEAAGGQFASARLFDSPLPDSLGLGGFQAQQRPELAFALRFSVCTICVGRDA